MKNQWFRLYSEILNDPKVQIVTEALRWRYVALLCLHCNGDYQNRPDDEIALALRVTVDDWQNTRLEFIKRGLINGDDYSISGWNKRQYISDIVDPTASQRQERYRNRKRNRLRNATVTSRLPEADTEQIQKQNKKDNMCPQKSYSPEFEIFWKQYPRHDGSKSDAYQSYVKATSGETTHDRIIRSLAAFSTFIASQGTATKHIPHATTWLNGKRWEADYTNTAIAKPKTYRSEAERIAAGFLSHSAGESPTDNGVIADMRDAETIR